MSVLLVASVAGSFVACGNEVKQTNRELNIYAWSSNIQDEMAYPISNFKSNHPGVEVNFVELPEFDGNNETYAEEFNETTQSVLNDLKVGSGSDLIIAPPAIFPDYYKTMASGAFVDLNPMLENDSEYDPTLYNQVVLDAGVYQGKRYSIPLFYDIPLIVTSRDTLNQVGFDLEKASTYDGLIEEALRCAEENKGRWPFYDFFAFTRRYTEQSGLQVLDYDKREVNLDTLEMKKMQEIYKSYLPYDDSVITNYSLDNHHIEQVLADQTIFVPDNFRNTYEIASRLQGDQIEPLVLPVRTFDGKIQADVTITSGIRNNSPNRENAYHFLRELMGDVFQMGGTYGKLAPTLPILIRNTYDKIYQIKQGTLDGYDNGVNLRSIGEDYVTKPLPDETYDLLIQWVNDIGYAAYYTNIEKKMNEYFAPYYKGEKSYEQYLSEAEAKLKIYMSE